jgi:hypothetical protein
MLLAYFLGTLMMFSDRLTRAEFALPIFAVCLLFFVRFPDARKRTLGIAAVVAAGWASAAFLETKINHVPFPTVSIADATAHIPRTWDQLGALQGGNLLRGELPIGLSLLIPCLLFLAYLPTLITMKQPEEKRRALFLWTYCACALACSFCAVIDLQAIRYFAGAAALPFAIIVILRLPRGREVLACLYVFTFGAACVQLHGFGQALPGQVVWKAPLTDCAIDLRDRLRLQAGLAAYWIARPLTASLDWTLQVDQLNQDGSPIYYMNDRFWFTKSFSDATRPPEYRFIVMDMLDEAAVRKRYGEPTSTQTCGASRIWLYDDPQRVRQALGA